MSRVLKRKIKIDSNFKMQYEDNKIFLQGSYGKFSMNNFPSIVINMNENEISFDSSNVKDTVKAASFVSNFENAVTGVQVGFKKTLNLVGVGYKVAKDPEGLKFNVGFSHPVMFGDLDEIEVFVESPVKLTLKSVNTVRLGDVCAKIISKTRPVEPYKGKGVILEGTYIIRKQGKKK